MDERVWTDTPLSHGETITLNGVTITRKRIGHTVIISGNITVALGHLTAGVTAAGLGEDVGGEDNAIRLGRDSAILNTKKHVDVAPGWHNEGYSLSHADGKYAVLEIVGENAELLLAQGASIAFKHPSPSAVIQFAGVASLLVKHNDAWLLFVERPMLTYICGFLADATINNQE